MGLIRTLHAWAGATLSLLLAVLGLTGTLLVFEDDWIRATVPAARAQAAPARFAQAAETAERTFGEELRLIVFAREGLGVHKAYLTDEGAAYLDAGGEVVARWPKNGRVEDWVFDLHHFLLAGEPGMIVAGVAALAGAALAITGVILWWPTMRSFGLRLWPGSGRRRDLLASHRDLGALFAIPVFVLCATGGGIIFYQETQALLGLGSPRPAAPPPPSVGAGKVDWAVALSGAQARFPDARLRMAVWPADGGPASIRMKQPAEWHPNGRTTVLVDPAHTRIVQARDALAEPAGMRLYNAFYPVHAASVGGRLYDAVCALSGLALAMLGVIGAWAFLKKPRGRRGRTNGLGRVAETPAE